jgi:hypothetical protein
MYTGLIRSTVRTVVSATVVVPTAVLTAGFGLARVRVMA